MGAPLEAALDSLPRHAREPQNWSATMTEPKLGEVSPYGDDFFRGNAASAEGSARPVLSILRDLYSPTSIVDVGCGSGGWLAVAGTLGFTELRGYDGPWADPKRFSGADVEFIPLDLEKYDLTIERRFDLAMSVEVAEHLSESRSDMLIDALCSASDIVLFGAAAPFQGGVHHIFERPQSYWIAKFADRGYEVFDFIRPEIWGDQGVRWWFQQNTFVFVKATCDLLDRADLRRREGRIVDVVHPASLERRVKALWVARRELAAVKKELEATRRRLNRARKQNSALQKQLAQARPRLRSMSSQQLPERVRPAARRLWSALPQDVRRRIRGR